MQRRSIVLTAAFAVAALSAGAALATTNQHVIGAQACTGQNVTNGYGALNTTAATEAVYCPTVLDHVQGTADVTAYVWDRHRTYAVDCWFWGKDNTGNIVATYPKSSVGAYANAVTLTTSVTIGLYEISVGCNVPPTDAGGPGGGVSGITSLVTHGY
jgi:hypothetical protein